MNDINKWLEAERKKQSRKETLCIVAGIILLIAFVWGVL